jgi:sigma-54-specific transcriptional regulator
MHSPAMLPSNFGPIDRVLTLPDHPAAPLSIRAKAMLFHDPQSVDLLAQVERIATTDATVLIIGETGTGKELIARHLHRNSGRAGPFVAVNCGAFSESMIDAELFGHEAGAFTGASGARAGWFETANGGTLFLDEIGDLPLALQVKLLRVLQERQVVRLGSRKPLSLDVRLVAATNIDLQRAVDAQRFRADLYWRLSVATVALPPLRERPGDVLPLVQHFIGIYAPRLKMRRVDLSTAAEAALLAYAWPGNIRELENVIHFALIVCQEACIEPGDLKLVSAHRTHAALAQAPRPATVPTVLDGHGAPIDAREAEAGDDTPALPPEDPLALLFDELLLEGRQDLFQRVEETLVRRSFAHCRDNQVQTARALGITRNTMRTLLKRYGLIADAAEPLVFQDQSLPEREEEEQAAAQGMAG